MFGDRSIEDQLQFNVRWFPAFVFCFAFHAWMPVFFLYFSERVSLAGVLQLESIYYLGVFLLEVPSGYASDRFGRRPTLLIATGSLITAYLLFLFAQSFPVLVLAQILLAGGMAFRSGTDTAFHYDSLNVLDRKDEYGGREAVVANRMLVAGALSALAGGLLGQVQLRFAYGLSGVFAIAAFLFVLLFREPDATDEGNEEPRQFFNHLLWTAGYLKNEALLWLFCFSVFMTTLIHIPYEFYQPYLDLLGQGGAFWQGATPVAAGVLTFLTKILSSGFALYSETIKRYLGLSRTLLISTLLLCLIILSMGLVLHWAIVGVILLRVAPKALYQAPMREAVTPLIDRTERATYLSMQSLAGRIGFSVVLFGLSLLAAGEASTSWSALSPMLLYSAALGGVGLLALVLTRKALETVDT